MKERKIIEIVWLLYKLFKSCKDSVELKYGFHGDIETRERELTNNKKTEGNYQIGICLKQVFGFAERDENAT